jgi:hypothetical protein
MSRKVLSKKIDLRPCPSVAYAALNHDPKTILDLFLR